MSSAAFPTAGSGLEGDDDVTTVTMSDSPAVDD